MRSETSTSGAGEPVKDRLQEALLKSDTPCFWDWSGSQRFQYIPYHLLDLPKAAIPEHTAFIQI